MGEWVATTLGAICEEAAGNIQTGPFGSQLHAGDYVAHGTPSVMPQNIGDNRIDPSGIALVSDADLARLQKYALRAGDIVYSRRGDVERRALVRPENEGWLCGTGCLRVRIANQARHSASFISYALGQPIVRAWITRHAVGATMLNLNTSILSRVPLLVPDVREQRAIAQVLGALDDKIAANEKAARIAFDLAHSMVLEVLNRSMGANCVPTKFGRLGDLFDGPHATPTRSTEGPYFLNISSLKSGRLDLAESDHVSELDFSKWTRRVTPQEGDLLFSYETRLGECALMPNGVRACLGRRMALLRPNRERVTPEFLLHFYLSPNLQRTIAERTVHGATVPRIGLATMGDWDVQLPALEQQEEVADTLRSLHAVTDQADRESARLATVRDELLPLLMSGKVRVKDAEAVAREVV